MHNASHPEDGKPEDTRTLVDELTRAQLREWRDSNTQQDGRPHSNASVARKLGYSSAVVSQYLAEGGNCYTGDITKLQSKINDLLTNEARRRMSGVETTQCEAADEIRDALENIRKTNDVGAVVAVSGEGKTRGIEIYRKANPLAILFHVCSWARDLGSVEGALFEAVGRDGYDNRTKRAVFMVKKLRGTDRLIIVDDAHKLTRPALQWLFDFHEQTGCPIAFVGTLALDDLLEDDAQRFSRVGLHSEIKPTNSRKLIAHLVATLAPDANGETQQLIALCEVVAAQHGHYRSVHKQLKLAAELKEGSKGKLNWVTAFRGAHLKLIRKYQLGA